MLQAAIKAFRPDSSVGEEPRKFAVTFIGGPPAAQASAGFGFPALPDGAITLAAVDAQPIRI